MYPTRTFRRKGQGLVEYALILVLVGIVVIIILGSMGGSIQKIFCNVAFKLGTAASALDKACPAPRVSFVTSTGSGFINIEAVVEDDKGNGSNANHNITKVVFYDNGTLVRPESTYRFCLGGGDGSCSNYSVLSGSHTIRAIAYDADGNTGEEVTTVNVP